VAVGRSSPAGIHSPGERDGRLEISLRQPEVCAENDTLKRDDFTNSARPSPVLACDIRLVSTACAWHDRPRGWRHEHVVHVRETLKRSETLSRSGRGVRGAVGVVVALASASCGGGSQCPVGRTVAENGTCVDQRVVDFVACIDRANGTERYAGSGTKLSADVRAASIGVATATEFQRAVSTRVYAGSDAQSQQILATCNSYIFGAVAQSGAPPYAGGVGPAQNVTPSPAPAPAPPAPAGARCATSLAIPTDNTWSLREREQWAALARGVQGALDAASSSCGARIGGTLVFDTFRGHFAPGNTKGLGNDGVEHVRAPFNAIQQICDEGEMQKAAVRARIQCIEVRYGGSGRSTWSLSGPVLTSTINPAGESDFDFRAEMRGPNGVKRSL
jgi:hypothetical protein